MARAILVYSSGVLAMLLTVPLFTLLLLYTFGAVSSAIWVFSGRGRDEDGDQLVKIPPFRSMKNDQLLLVGFVWVFTWWMWVLLVQIDVTRRRMEVSNQFDVVGPRKGE